MSDFSTIAKRLLSFQERDLGSGASDDEIGLAERELGVRFEGGYRQFVKQFGWGGVEHLELYGLGSTVPLHLNLVRVTKSERVEMEPKLPQNFIPVMNDGGGNLFCLDTNTPEEPPIVLWDHTGGTDQLPTVEAESFAEWLGAQLDYL